jgi:hypothetical protein
MSTQHLPEASTPQELRVNVPLLDREARVVVTPAASGVKPKPLKDAPALRGNKLLAELVVEDRR